MSLYFRVSALLALFIAGSTGLCPAQGQSDWRDCQTQNLDVNIPACSRIIDNAGTSARDRMEAYLQRGFAYLAQNAAISAERDFDKVMAQQADNAKALAGRAIARFRRGETTAAILDYSLARLLDLAGVDDLAVSQPELRQVAAAAGQTPPPQEQLDEITRRLIPCRPGTQREGLSCTPIVCGAGQRLDGNNCVEIVCGPGTRRQNSDCVAIQPPRPPPPPTLLAAAAASRWCTLRREYSLTFEGDKIVWRDSFGAVDIERVVADDVAFAQTVTVDSRRTQGTTVPRGTVWSYRASGHSRIDVSKNGGASFSLTRC